MIHTLQNHLNRSNNKHVRLKQTMFAGFRPLFCFSRITGLMPFSIVCNSNGEVQSCKVKVVDVVWFVISICVCILLAIWNSYCLYSNISHHSPAMIVLNATGPILSILCFTFSALFYAINMWNRQKFLGILQNLERFDKEVSFNILYIESFPMYLIVMFLIQMLTLNVHQNYERDYRRSWQCIPISMMLFWIWMFSTYYVFGDPKYLTTKYAVYTCSCFVHGSMTLTVFITFITLLNNLYRRFACVNSWLRYQ